LKLLHSNRVLDVSAQFIDINLRFAHYPTENLAAKK